MPSSILYDYVVVEKAAEAESYAYCLVFRHERATLPMSTQGFPLSLHNLDDSLTFFKILTSFYPVLRL